MTFDSRRFVSEEDQMFYRRAVSKEQMVESQVFNFDSLTKCAVEIETNFIKYGTISAIPSRMIST